MPWPYRCANCNSGDTQAGVHEISCLKCGRLTDKDGVLVPLEVQNHSTDHYEEMLLAELAALKAELNK